MIFQNFGLVGPVQERITFHLTCKRIPWRNSGDAYSFQCGMELLIWGWKMIALVVGWVVECCIGLDTWAAIPQWNTENFK